MLESIVNWVRESKKALIVLAVISVVIAGVGYCVNSVGNSLRCGGFLTWESGMTATPTPVPAPGERGYSWSAIAPQWTPDGESIVFTHLSGPGENYSDVLQVYKISHDGRGLKLLLDGISVRHHSLYFDFSSDVSQVAYSVYRQPGTNSYFYEIERANLQSGDKQTLTPSNAYDLSPSWSRDASRIAFERDANSCRGHKGDDYGLFVMKANGKDVERLPRVPSPEDVAEHQSTSESDEDSPSWHLSALGGFSWSPDGYEMALVADLSFYQGELNDLWNPKRLGLYLLKTDDTPAKRLQAFETRSGNWDSMSIFGAPLWSQDGQRIIYVRNIDGRVKLWSISRGGDNLSEIVDAGVSVSPYLEFSCGPTWSPDGSQIMFSVPGTTFIVNADGSNLRSFEGSSCASWSPDGTMFASMEGGLHVVTIKTGGHRALTALSDKGVLLSAEAARAEGVPRSGSLLTGKAG